MADVRTDGVQRHHGEWLPPLARAHNRGGGGAASGLEIHLDTVGGRGGVYALVGHAAALDEGPLDQHQLADSTAAASSGPSSAFFLPIGHKRRRMAWDPIPSVMDT